MTTINYFFLSERSSRRSWSLILVRKCLQLSRQTTSCGVTSRSEIYTEWQVLSESYNQLTISEPAIISSSSRRSTGWCGARSRRRPPRPCCTPTSSWLTSPLTRYQRSVTWHHTSGRQVYMSTILQRRGVVKSNNHLPQSASLYFSFTNKNEMQTTTFGLS